MDTLHHYNALLKALQATPGRRWLEILPEQITTALSAKTHGHAPQWQAALQSLPQNIPASSFDLNAPIVSIGQASDCDSPTRNSIIDTYRAFMPWRKGPYEIFGELIDTEWRSDLKWDRLSNEIRPLIGKLVLDVGCGNGYHCWRMLGNGAARVVGIDPTILFVYQFLANKHFLPDQPVDVLPLSLEQLPINLQTFDTAFSMGVLYHRPSPIDHLLQLRGCLKPGGELVLETLVIDGDEGYSLVPEGRYAGMKNIWFIPSIKTLTLWMRRCGFEQIRCINITATTPREQRTTDWIKGKSLIQSIDPDNPELTIEGLPSPRRAILIAIRQKTKA